MTAEFDQSTLDAIDIRIAAALKALPELHPATMVSRATSGSAGTAQFFGSSLAVPVKVPAGVHAFAGDPVGLARFGPSDWTVVYCYTRWDASEAGVDSVAGNDSTTSASYSAISGVPTFTFRKRYDDTRVGLWMSAGLFSATSPAQGEYAVQLDDGTTATDYFLIRLRTDAGGHVSAAAADDFAGVAAGLYTVTARWRKTSGGTMQLNNIDTVSVRVREIGPAHP